MTDKHINQAKGRVRRQPVLAGDQLLKSEGHVDHAKGSLEKSGRQGRRHGKGPEARARVAMTREVDRALSGDHPRHCSRHRSAAT